MLGIFFKKHADGTEIRNPSGLIHTYIKNENESRGFWDWTDVTDVMSSSSGKWHK